MPLDPGTQLGPYNVTAQIGAGGMGEVYKATDTRLDRTVAIKVLPEHVAADPDLKQRFEHEARMVAALNHPHICTLHDIGSQDGIDFLVMEYLDGETLAQRLEKGALPLDQALTIAIEIADALDKAHRQGIVHRDLKPGNIMLTKAGAKLLDFGLAKLAGEGATRTGTAVETVAYMSPEQVQGQKVDHCTDIWSLGVILYEMLAGTPPFQGENVLSRSNAIVESDPPSLTGPLSPAQSVVSRALSKDRGHRYGSVNHLLGELRRLRGFTDSPTVEAPTRPNLSTGPSSPNRLPTRVGRYEIIEAMGGGGMGELYIGHDPAIDRRVVIKLLQDRIDSPRARERFEREGRAAGRLSHKNVVVVFEVGESHARPWIAMEYISGETLAAKISARAEVPLATKLRYIEELCSGLHYAHRNGVIHRDVKPSNIMIDDEDLVKILDFGIAHFVDSPVTRTGSLVGTPNYMAPEQVLGRTINERTDVFAVGAVFYELLTSQRAFPGDLVAAIHRILNKEPEPIARVLPTLDRQVVRIVGRALAKDPGQRYSNLEAMATDIAAVRRRVDLGLVSTLPGNITGAGQVPDPDLAPTVTASPDASATHQRSMRWLYGGVALAGVAAAAALTFVQPQPDSIEQPLRPPAPVSAPELPASDSTAFPQTDLEPGRSAQPAATDALAPASPSPEPANGVRSSGLADDAPLADPPETGPPPLPSPLPEAAVAEASTSTEDGSDTPLADSTNTVSPPSPPSEAAVADASTSTEDGSDATMADSTDTVSPSLASAPLALGATAAPVVAGRTSGTLLGAQTQASPEGASNVPATSASADEIASVPLGTTPPDASTAAVPASGPAPPPPMDDRAAIEQLLNQYRSAYEAKDVNRVLSVFPTLPNVSEVELAFSEASEVLIGFTPPDIRLTSTTTATASLKAHPEFRPKGRWKRYV